MPAKKIDKTLRQELRQAIEANAPSLLQPLIKAGVSVNQNVGEDDPISLLEFAIEKNAVEVVRFLIGAGADLDKGRNKPLIHAALFNRVEIVELLLEAGADPNITVADPDEGLRRVTALMCAAEMPERIRIVELLLKHNANPNLETNDGLTALDYAVDYQNIEAVRLILAAGGKPFGPILHGPVFRGNKVGLEIVRLLIAAGADLNAIGNREAHLDGRTALDGAREVLNDKLYMIRLVERRPREAWEEEVLQRWKSEARIYEEIIEELRGARANASKSSTCSS